MRFLLLAAALAAGPAIADSEARHGADWVRFTALPCKDEAVQAQIKLLGLDPLDFRAARAEFEGKGFAGCWRPAGGVVHVIYDDGDQGIVPVAEMKPLRET